MGAIRFAGQSVILHYRLKLTLASYRNQDIGQVAICSKTLFRSVWTVWQNCVVEQCKCSRTVWRILLSESVWCPWQPASQQPPPQQDAIFIFPIFFFSSFPPFFCFFLIPSFLRSHPAALPVLSSLFWLTLDFVFVFVLTSCLSLPCNFVCLCLNIAFVIVIVIVIAQGNLCCPSTSVR